MNHSINFVLAALCVAITALPISAAAHPYHGLDWDLLDVSPEPEPQPEPQPEPEPHPEPNPLPTPDPIDGELPVITCNKATAAQIAVVNQGNAKAQDFLDQCLVATTNSPWCYQLMRPNPSSLGVFRCTYGEEQPHQLIHPDTSSWKNAFAATRLVDEMEKLGIKVCLIYNWWRPEPYNRNVGGVPSRHPFGTSVDVRFCSMDDMEKAFRQLCRWRKQGRLRAIGYYGSTALHLGIADKLANTWGKRCPAKL